VALDVELTTVTGPWLRHTPAGANPATRPVPADDNRWQRGKIVDALYLCEDEACVWAEWYRHLAERGIPPQLALPRDLWTYELDGLDVADFRSAHRLTRVGLPEPLPGRRSWPLFQAVGERPLPRGFRRTPCSERRPPAKRCAVRLPADDDDSRHAASVAPRTHRPCAATTHRDAHVKSLRRQVAATCGITRRRGFPVVFIILLDN